MAVELERKVNLEYIFTIQTLGLMNGFDIGE